MKKSILILFTLFLWNSIFSQTNNDQLHLIVKAFPGVYVDVVADSKPEVQKLINDFSIERGDVKQAEDKFNVKIWITLNDVQKFIDKNIPFSIDWESIDYELLSPTLTMATTVAQMASWNRYPTYSVYLQMMSDFQTNFPEFCQIDTILANTARNHAILAAKVGNLTDNVQNKPAFLYSAAMHGDEICGYVLMLRLIDYMLNNQSDPVVSKILNSVDLYICPLENPDGTFPTNNNSVSGSVRSNAGGYDLNRNYPEVNQTQQPTTTIAEINAMLQFIQQKSIIMAGNFHGGAELYNYAWDYWTTAQLQHPDRLWWMEVGWKFYDTLRQYSPATYFTDEGGVTNGGDWYVVDGSKLDCLNYYYQCRDVTFEISATKKTPAANLPNYWNYLYRSLLHYVYESALGFSGTITDSITHTPLEALVFITSHDNNQSCVYSFLPAGKYHRPIKNGTYSVTYSAPGYRSKTFPITVVQDSLQIQNVELVPINHAVNESLLDSYITVYPNPATNFLIIDDQSKTTSLKQVAIFDVKGNLIFETTYSDNSVTVSTENFKSGLYFITIKWDNQLVVRKLIKK